MISKDVFFFYFCHVAFQVLNSEGVRHCRSAIATWCGHCIEAVPPIKSNCAIHGRFPHPQNCSLFIECSGSGSTSYACVCSCANRTMVFNSRLGVCVPSLSNSTGVSKTNCTILETHLNLLDGSRLHPLNATSREKTTEPLTLSKDSQSTDKSPNTVLLQRTTTARTRTEKPRVASAGSTITEAGNLDPDGRWWKREKGLVIHDNPAVPTWVVALLVFLGVLVLLVVVLSLYH